MKRREFLARCAALAGSVPFFSFLHACESPVAQLYADFEVNFEGKILVVGAGAAGLAAGYILDRYGVEFEILEASSVIGGRTKRAPDFADFPIDLGAEWLHDQPYVLAQLVDDPSVDASVELVPYSPDTISQWHRGQLRKLNLGSNYYGEYKFKRTTWFGFLERYIAAPILDRVVLDTPIERVDHSSDRVVLHDAAGQLHEADRVLMTTPLKVLQDGLIEYVPALPAAKLAAAARVTVPDGLKVFFEFDERFYPDLIIVGGLLDETALNKLFYDAAFRKQSSRHVLGLFHVGPRAAEYVGLDDDALIETLLDELDAMFDGQARQHFVKAVVQNWSRLPYIRGAYPTQIEGDERSAIAELAAPLEDRVFFAGAALDAINMSTVHGAMQSAYRVVEQMLALA